MKCLTLTMVHSLSHYVRILIFFTLYILMKYPMHVDRICVELPNLYFKGLPVRISVNDIFLSLYLSTRLGVSSVQSDNDILIWSSSQQESCVGSKYLCSWLIKDSDSY